MKSFCWLAAASLAAGLVVASQAGAQVADRTPHIGYIHPAGGQKGTTVTVLFGGMFLEGATNVFITGAGVETTVGKYHKPFEQNDGPRIRNALERNQQLLEKKLGKTLDFSFKGDRCVGADAPLVMKEAKVTEEDFVLLAEYRMRAADKKRQLNPQITDDVTVTIKIAPDAKPGPREMRLMTPGGVSNPLAFYVGDMPEVQEQEPNDKDKGTVLTKPLPLVLNGQIMPGDVDRFSFKAVKGQKLVVVASARELVPELADAVPGWFQATLALFGPNGREVAYADDFKFDPDPVLYYEIPENGEYVLEIKDAIYRGREDFVYRVTVGEIPFVTGIQPLGAPAGAPAQVELKGWNLESTKTTLPVTATEPTIQRVSLMQKGRLTNPVPFAVDTLPESPEKEPNDTTAQANRLSAATILNARIDKPGDIDVYRFDCRLGDVIIAEVLARRLHSPVDSILRVTDANGRTLEMNDDFEDKGAPLATHHADSRIAFKATANGPFFFHVEDAQKKGGDAYAYRLRISPPRPDFELRVVPASLNARGGTTVPIAVYALRKDGFPDEIALTLKGAPASFVVSGPRIPAGADHVRMTMTVPFAHKGEPIKLSLEGRAVYRGKELIRQAVPAEDMMQAFAYHHLIPAKEWLVDVTTSGGRSSAQALKPTRADVIRVRPGGTARIPLSGVVSSSSEEQLNFALSDPPEGLTIDKVSTQREGVQIVVSADAKAAKVGTKGNLIVEAFYERPEGKGGGGGQRRMIGILPAIPFEISAL